MVYNKLVVASSLIGGAEMVPRVGRRAKYESVAISIADQVAKGIYVINERLRGRSTLASLYKVSPETIRRAMALLEAHGVVKVTQGSGIRVLYAMYHGGYRLTLGGVICEKKILHCIVVKPYSHSSHKYSKYTS